MDATLEFIELINQAVKFEYNHHDTGDEREQQLVVLAAGFVAECDENVPELMPF